MALYAPAVGLLVAVTVVATVTGIAPSKFTRDPALLAEAHPFLGVVSNVGILLWAAAASISLFTAALLRTRHQESERAAFLLGAGLLTSWLLLDDLFLLHEWLFPLVLGVPELLVVVSYVALAALLLVRFVGLIRRTEYRLLTVALGFFALSLALDQLPQAWYSWEYLYLIEDGPKLLGIVSWLGYFGRVCLVTLAGHSPRA